MVVISAELVVVYFDFRLSDIKGVEARGSAPDSKEYGKSQPLCFSLSPSLAISAKCCYLYLWLLDYSSLGLSL